MQIWFDYKGNKEALIEKINEFICSSLNGAIRTNKKKEERTKRKPSNKDKRKYNNRSRRKRYSCARCQELLKGCPRKLADLVINNDCAYPEPSRQPPEAIEVKRLYEHLWGRAGPSSPPIPGNRVSEFSINEIFPPITAGDVGERITKIGNKFAAGPDGLQKEYLLVPGLPEILAKIFNILCYSSCFPTVWKDNFNTEAKKE